MNVQPTYVNYSQAKLLKEKGFDEKCSNYYHIRGRLMNLETGDTGEHECDAPEQWQVIEFFRLKYGIWISISLSNDINGNNCFKYTIVKAEIVGIRFITEANNYNSPQEAYSSAFDYVLNNLV
jgi:hypothetical protein